MSSKIGEGGERFPVESENIIVKVVATSVSPWIKIVEGFSMISYFQSLNRNFHCPRVSTRNVGRAELLEQSLNNPVTGTPNKSKGNLGVAKKSRH